MSQSRHFCSAPMTSGLPQKQTLVRRESSRRDFWMAAHWINSKSGAVARRKHARHGKRGARMIVEEWVRPAKTAQPPTDKF
jgi:hypothetical protein